MVAAPTSLLVYASLPPPPLLHMQQAHDFEAYQEMLAAQAVASSTPAMGERYEQISKFLQGESETGSRVLVARQSQGAAAAVDTTQRGCLPLSPPLYWPVPAVCCLPLLSHTLHTPCTHFDPSKSSRRSLLLPPSPLFLADTEDYLHKLASKIASVKMSAEISKAMQRAQEEARAQVGGGLGWAGLAWCSGRALVLGGARLLAMGEMPATHALRRGSSRACPTSWHDTLCWVSPCWLSPDPLLLLPPIPSPSPSHPSTHTGLE